MSEHAKLAPSAAYRWLKCTAAPAFEAQFPDTSSPYAEAGTLAHEICEIKARRALIKDTPKATATRRLNKLRKDPAYDPEMDRTSDLYADYLATVYMAHTAPPYVQIEQRLDLEAYVPEGFGRADCIMIGDRRLTVIDYKHGKGVAVDAQDNPQMRLYALGALRRYMPLYGDTIDTVCMVIFQPRLRAEPLIEEISKVDLLAWGESIKPIADKAYHGIGPFVPGAHCQFCKGKAVCRARAGASTALEEFADMAAAQKADGKDAFTPLSPAEIGGLLERGKHLVAWYHDLEEYAQKRLLDGQEVPGWKMVEGRSVRQWSDQDKALEAIQAAGWDAAMLYERRAKTLAEIEKLMGKKEFSAVAAPYVIKPAGKPTLAPEKDPRPAFNSAEADFRGVAEK